MGQLFPELGPSFRDLGKIGGINYKIGAIKRMATQSCNPDATLAVLAMWQSAPTLIWSLFGPDCVDMVNDRAGGGHRRKRGYKWKQAGIIPGKGQGSGFGWALFKLGGLGQRAGWYFSIADVTSDFIVNWMSLAMIYDGCSGAGGNPYANGTVDAPGVALIFPGIWVPLSFTHWDYGGGAVGAGSTVAYLSGTDASGTISGYLTPAEGIPPPNIFKLRVIHGANTLWEGQGDDPYRNGTKQMGGFFSGPGTGSGGVVQAQYWLDVGGIFTGSWNVAGIEGNPDWPTITGAPCASNINSDDNWSDYWKKFVG